MNDIHEERLEPRRLIAAIELDVRERLVARDGAISAGGMTSSRVAAGLAMASVPIALAALASDVFAQGDGLPDSVVDVLNFALTLEYLESEFYTTGVGTSGLLAPDTRDVFDQIRKHEVAHVQFLQTTLGGRAVNKPAFDFTAGGAFADVFRNPATFGALAQAFEDTGVRAYKGQAANLMGHRVVLRSALRIHSVEARHASQVRRMRGQKGWISGSSASGEPDAAAKVYEGEDNTFQFILAQPGHGVGMSEAFDETLTKGQVLDIVKPFLAGGR